MRSGGTGLTMPLAFPGDHGDLGSRIENLGRAGLEPMAGKHLLRRPPWYPGKDRTSAGQAGAMGPRKVECVITDLQEQAKGVGAADHRQRPIGHLEGTPCLLE